MRRQGVMVLMVCMLALAGCGGKQRTTVTTVRVPAVAAVGAPTSLARTVQPQAAVTAAPVAGGGVRASAGSSPRSLGIGKTLLGASIGGTIIAAANGGVVGIAGATGPQCENPYGGQAASRNQAICSDTQERLDCSCTETSCELIATGIPACGPAGQVVN